MSLPSTRMLLIAVILSASSVATGQGVDLVISEAAIRIERGLPSGWTVVEREAGQIPWGHHWCNEYRGTTGIKLIAVGPKTVNARMLDRSTGKWADQPMAKEAVEIWIMPGAYRDSPAAALCVHRPIQPESIARSQGVAVWARPAHRLNSAAEFNAALAQSNGSGWPESPWNDWTKLSWASWKRDLASAIERKTK